MDRTRAKPFNDLMGAGEAGTTPATSSLLLSLARDVTGSLDLQQVLDESLRALRRLIPFGGGSIQLIRDGALRLAAADPAPEPRAWQLGVPVGQGVSGRIAASGDAVYIPDIYADPRVPPAGSRALSPGVVSYFGVPLIAGGAPIGIVQLDSPELDGFPVGAREIVLAFTPTIAAAVQNAQVYAREAEALEKIRASERFKDEFLAMVSHELRTPLTTINGFSELLATRAEQLSPPLIEEFARRMWRAGRWLSRMIEDLLDLSEIERGTMALDALPTSVEEIVLDATAVPVRDAHPVRREIEPGLPAVVADPSRLRQVLGNLLSNARKFSPPGAPITVQAAREGSRVAITVADGGRGIPPEELERIFDAFVQTDPALTRAAGGLGTGLYLVKQLCERMGAEVRVDSRPGEGSRFTILLRSAERYSAAS